MSKTKISKREVSSKQKQLFKIIAGIIPILFLLIFEGVLRLAGYGDNLNLFIQNPTKGYEKYMMVNPEVGKKYFQKFEYTAPANDIFLAEKPDNTFRIFVMGSSTVYGFPYERNLMFSRILHKQLEDAYPDKKIEMVNTAITAINSFTLLDFTKQILKYKPDAVLIYAGHNEFYGAFGIGSNETMSRNRELTQLNIALMDIRIYQLIRNIISGVSQKIGKNKNEVHGTLMKRMVASKDILLHSEEYNIAMERFRQNMSDILEKNQKKKVPVFLSEVISNVRGMEPFNSVAKDTLEAAIDVFKKAKAEEENGDFGKALQLYYKAKDLDCIRFRASEDVNRIINELAVEYKANRIPMLDWFQSNSPNKLIGDNLLTEHVHPNIKGNFLMAEAFFTGIVKSGLLGNPSKNEIHPAEYSMKNYGYTVLDSLVAIHRVGMLRGNWPFVKEGGEEFNYLQIYQPVSYLDSIAFWSVEDPSVLIGESRLDLARKYEKSGQIAKAFKEYDALLRTNPYISVNYRDAVTCLLQLGDLPLALKYLEKSLEYEESFFAYFRMGEIYQIMGDYNNSIKNFEKSFSLAPDDQKTNILGKTLISCVYGNKKDQGNAIAKELKKVNATQYFKIPQKKYLFNNYIPYQTKEQVNRAKELIDENKSDEALTELETSLHIYDSHIANRLIGEIYFNRQNIEKASSYFEKIYDQFKFDSRFLHDLALIYNMKNDYEKAGKCFQEIKEIDPGYEQLKQLSEILSKRN
jgi:tetratricopeptide (TPR) repeat protein